MNSLIQVTPENRPAHPLTLLCDAAEHLLHHPDDAQGFRALLREARRLVVLRPALYPAYAWLDAALLRQARKLLLNGGAV